MKIYSIVAAVMLLTSVDGVAQQIDKSVEVRRNYLPQLERATKPTFAIDVEDTLSFNPNIGYTIQPTTVNTSVVARPIAAAKITYWEHVNSSNMVLKIGAGIPSNTLLNGYYSRFNASTGYFLGYINHSGDYLKLPNPVVATEGNATQIENEFGIVGGFFLGKRALNMSFVYDNDRFHRYAFASDAQDFNSRITYQSADFNISFGDNFVNLTRWNFMTKVSANHFWDRLQNHNSTLGVEGIVSKELVEYNSLTFKGIYDQYILTSGGESRMAHLAGIDARYSYTTEEWNTDIGVLMKSNADQYLDNDEHASTYNLLIPCLSVSYNGYGWGSVFAVYDSDMTVNNYATISQRNPYIESNGLTSMRSTIYYAMQFGIEGQIQSRKDGQGYLRYKVYGEWKTITNDLLWILNVNTESGYNYSMIEYVDQNIVSLNIEGDYKPLSDLHIEFDSRFNYFSGSKNSSGYLYGVSPIVNKLKISYLLGDFSFNISGETRSARNVNYIVDIDTYEVRLPATINLGLGIDWAFSDVIGAFCTVDNIANQTIYDYFGYRKIGVSATAGVKITF